MKTTLYAVCIGIILLATSPAWASCQDVAKLALVIAQERDAGHSADAVKVEVFSGFLRAGVTEDATFVMGNMMVEEIYRFPWMSPGKEANAWFEVCERRTQ